MTRQGALTRTLLLLFATMLFGCGEGEVIEKNAPDEEVRNLVDEAEAIQSDVAQGRVFRSMADRDRKQMEELIYRSKIAVLRLGENPANRDLIDYVFRLSHRLNQFQILRRDRPRIEKYFNKIRQLAKKYARKIGYTSLQAQPWQLFSYRFSDTLYPFGSVSRRNNWQADWSQDEPHAAIRSSFGNAKSWLVSPTFDLSQVDSPHIRIDHTILLNAGDSNNPFDRAAILKDGFNVLVSTDYDGGKPKLENWEKLDIRPLPSSRNFHSVKSPLVDVSRFKGKNVTFALYYNMQHGPWNAGFVIWQINKFELLGVGDLPDYNVIHPGWIRGNIDHVFKYDFSLDGVKDLTQATLSGNPAHFQNDSHGEDSFVSINGFDSTNGNREGTRILSSPVIDLTEAKQDAGIWLKHTINKYEDAEKQDLVKVVAFKEGELSSPENHVQLKFENFPTGDSWDPVTSEILKLPQDLQGKRIQIGFVYTSSAQKAPAWQLYEVGILKMPGLNE